MTVDMNKIIFEKYIQEVKEQLCCNMSEKDKTTYICYEYTENDIDNNIDYFNKCYQDGLSAYKALLFFFNYLQEIKK